MSDTQAYRRLPLVCITGRRHAAPFSGLYCCAVRAALLLGIAPLCIGLFDASLTTLQKGFYAVSFVLSVGAAIAVHQIMRELRAMKAVDARDASGETPGSELPAA